MGVCVCGGGGGGNPYLSVSIKPSSSITGTRWKGLILVNSSDMCSPETNNYNVNWKKRLEDLSFP